MGVMYEVRRSDDLRWNNIHTRFHEDQFKHSRNIKAITSPMLESVALVLLVEGI
jgi:hypothetical protein